MKRVIIAVIGCLPAFALANSNAPTPQALWKEIQGLQKAHAIMPESTLNRPGFGGGSSADIRALVKFIQPPSAEARVRQKPLLPAQDIERQPPARTQSNSIAIIHNVVEIMDFPQSGVHQKVRLCVLLVQKSGQPLLAGD